MNEKEVYRENSAVLQINKKCYFTIDFILLYFGFPKVLLSHLKNKQGSQTCFS